MGNIHTSGEDYLEAILVLWNKQNGEVRSIDVARELNVTKPLSLIHISEPTRPY